MKEKYRYANKKFKDKLRFYFLTFISNLSVVLFSSLTSLIILAALGIESPYVIIPTLFLLLITMLIIQVIFFSREIEKDAFKKFVRTVTEKRKESLKSLYRISFMMMAFLIIGVLIRSYAGSIGLLPSFVCFLVFSFLILKLILTQIFINTSAYRLGADQDTLISLYRESQALAMFKHHPFSYNNYCAIRNGICEKDLYHHGKESFFLAYPFCEPFKGNAEVIRDHLSSQDYSVILPIEYVRENQLVCDNICKLMMSCYNFAADVTIPNRNVYFEYGFAKALRLTCWLMVKEDDNRDRPPNDFLPEITQLPYKDPLDAAEKLIKAHTEEPLHIEVIKNSEIPIPFISNKTHHGKEEIRKVFIITQGTLKKREEMSNPGVIQIHEELVNYFHNARHPFTLIGEQLNQPFQDISQNIQRADLIVFAFSTGEEREYEIYNSVISYFAGTAIALQKRVIVLEDKSVKNPMLDLRVIIKPIKNITEIPGILNGAIYPLISAQKQIN